MRWGLVGPGQIAQRFAAALATLPDARLHAVVGRDASRAQDFAARWGCRACADVATMLADPALDAVYIATTHNAHAEVAAACLRAGKPVLCEKPLAATGAQARALVALSQERGVFLMEALWTRFLPAAAVVQGWLREAAIGRIRALQSSFGFNAPYDPASRNFDPALAGGTLLDIGVYCLSLSQWVMALQGQHDAPRMQVLGVLAPTGVEQRCAVNMQYADGTLSQFSCAFDSAHYNRLRIYGESGLIELGPQFWQATEAVLQLNGEPAMRVPAPFECNGFEYQIRAAMASMRAGDIECAPIPHVQTLAVQDQIDELRRALGARP
jgi:predicted dehydrogenase